MDVPFPMIVTESESCVKLTMSKTWIREVKAISLLCPWNKINVRSSIIIESYLVCGVRQNASFMEKCLLMIMNGSSLDLSVIGILGIKTRRPLCVPTVHHFQYNHPVFHSFSRNVDNLGVSNKDNDPSFNFS